MTSHSNRQSSASLDVLKQLRAIFNIVKQHFRPPESACRVSGAQIWALTIVTRQPGLRVSELARAMAVHQSTASNLVERLAEQKMMEKRRSELDQRVVRLYPLPEGVELVKKLPLPVKGVLPEALSKLSPQKLAELQNILEELLNILYAGKSGGNTSLP